MIPGATLRTDAWWIEQLLVVLVLGGFGVYATWAALVNAHYYAAPYLSPFYSPCLAQELPARDRCRCWSAPGGTCRRRF